MLSANFGTKSAMFNLSDPWWINVVANAYAHVQLGDFEGSQQYNGSGTYTPVLVAAALKSVNPRIKTQLYAASDRGDLSPLGTAQINAHQSGGCVMTLAMLSGFESPRKGNLAIPSSIPAYLACATGFLTSVWTTLEREPRRSLTAC